MRQFLYQIKVFLTGLWVYPRLAGGDLDYDQYWQEKKKGALGLPNSFQVERGEWIASRIQPEASVIDIGCGDGSVLFAIRKHKPIRAVGVDVSKFILRFLEENGIESFYMDLSDSRALKELPLKEHALLLEVLEHMPKPEEYLLQVLSRVQKSVFVSVPNTGFIQHRLRLLFGKFPLQWRTHPSEHLRFWTVDDFAWWIRALGLERQTVFHCYAGIPFLNRVWPSLFAQGIIAEIKK